MQDFPVRPEMRLMEKHEFSDYKVMLLEQPDLMVDMPYHVLVDSKVKALGVGVSLHAWGTLVEAKQAMNAAIDRFIDHRTQEAGFMDVTMLFEKLHA